MVIKASLSKEQFIRLSLMRHVQRKTFYFYAITAALFTAYAVVWGPYLILLVAWLPFTLYLLFGVIGIFRDGANKDQPFFLKTRYEVTKQGVSISTDLGDSQLEWSHFTEWKVITNCYVLTLASGPILAIPQTAVPGVQAAKFEALLRNHIR